MSGKYVEAWCNHIKLHCHVLLCCWPSATIKADLNWIKPVELTVLRNEYYPSYPEVPTVKHFLAAA